MDTLIVLMGVLSTVNAVVASVLFYRSYRLQRCERVRALELQMYEALLSLDDDLLDHPDIQVVLNKKKGIAVDYFTDEALETEECVKVKVFIYKVMNIFDWLITTARQEPEFMKSVEWKQWEDYIRLNLAHPLYYEVAYHETDLWGAGLAGFLEANKARIEEMKRDYSKVKAF